MRCGNDKCHIEETTGNFCGYCGTKLVMELKCGDCGCIVGNNKFCRVCGKVQKGEKR